MEPILALDEKQERIPRRPLALAPRRAQGADVTPFGVEYRIWSCHSLEVAIVSQTQEPVRIIPLIENGEGYLIGVDQLGRAGDLYFYRFPDGKFFPDPASRFQPLGVHGPSQVVDPGLYEWKDSAWEAPPLSELVIYELHIGTFTREGTFSAAILKLPYLVDLGISAIELMPIADFPGSRNWGYDGVSLYAPTRSYGTPDELRALVDAAHGQGLAVILDVVYNHLGPDGNYTGCYHPDYFNKGLQTPWGAGLNFENRKVRQFFCDNPVYWRNEFHFDGFRLDATHAIADPSSPHILDELTSAIHGCGAFAVAEDDRRDSRILAPNEGGGLGFDGCWADDFHHVVHVAHTGEDEGYYADYAGVRDELIDILRNGWLRPVAGSPSAATDLCRSEQFVFCISNHDQVGNRAFGERLGQLISPAAYRAASALLCLIPQTPLLFMGQEWNASTAFQFFTDHHAALGRQVSEGRRQEFRKFAAFADDGIRQSIPDPQYEETYCNSKLRWAERHVGSHAEIWNLYHECLKLRRTRLHPEIRQKFEVRPLGSGSLVLLYGSPVREFAVMTDLRGSAQAADSFRQLLDKLDGREEWRCILSSEDPRFGGPLKSTALSSRTEVFVRSRSFNHGHGPQSSPGLVAS